MKNTLLTVGAIVLITIGIAGGIAMAYPANSGVSVPVCLIDKPIEDCQIYESGQAAWTPILMTGGV